MNGDKINAGEQDVDRVSETPTAKVDVEGRKKSRKQAKPVRFARGAPISDPEALAAAAAARSLRKEEQAEPPTKSVPRPKKEPAERKPEVKKRKRDPPPPSSAEFVAPSSNFDVSEVAASFIADDFREGRNSLGEVAQDTFTSAARLHSISAGKAKIEDGADAREIVVTFKGNNRKVYQDRCQSYTKEQAEDIIREILSRNRGTKRRAASYKHLLTVQELSSRMPPLLWSLYRCSKNVESLLDAMVAEQDGGSGGGRSKQPQVYTLDSDSD